MFQPLETFQLPVKHSQMSRGKYVGSRGAFQETHMEGSPERCEGASTKTTQGITSWGHCWWQPEIRQTHQLRLLVYPDLQGFSTFQNSRWLFGISSINSIFQSILDFPQFDGRLSWKNPVRSYIYIYIRLYYRYFWKIQGYHRYDTMNLHIQNPKYDPKDPYILFTWRNMWCPRLHKKKEGSFI